MTESLNTLICEMLAASSCMAGAATATAYSRCDILLGCRSIRITD